MKSSDWNESCSFFARWIVLRPMGGVGAGVAGFDPGPIGSGSREVDVMRRGRILGRGAALLCAAIVLPSASASATTLLLSEFSSDGTPATDLTALFNFSVIGSTLTFTVTNQTQTTTSGYNMNQLYFNTSTDVTDLTLTGASGSQDGPNLSMWTLYAKNKNVTKAEGFGKFDWALKDSLDGDLSTIQPTEVQTFTLALTCAGGATCDNLDFGLELSVGPGTHVLGAAQFVAGPGDDSAFGGTTTTITTTPEPSPAALLGLGLLALALHRRRAH
jgi:MYXO-CTERM domain-containing protein